MLESFNLDIILPWILRISFLIMIGLLLLSRNSLLVKSRIGPEKSSCRNIQNIQSKQHLLGTSDRPLFKIEEDSNFGPSSVSVPSHSKKIIFSRDALLAARPLVRACKPVQLECIVAAQKRPLAPPNEMKNTKTVCADESSVLGDQLRFRNYGVSKEGVSGQLNPNAPIFVPKLNPHAPVFVPRYVTRE